MRNSILILSTVYHGMHFAALLDVLAVRFSGVLAPLCFVKLVMFSSRWT